VEAKLGSSRGEADPTCEFPSAPSSWYCLGSVSDLARGPLWVALPGGHEFVGYQAESGRFVVLSARCSHMGADLSKGGVAGECLSCPMHAWEYGPDGLCTRIPAASDIPSFARQVSFPVEERGGHLFFFNRPQARFPMPFFEGMTPEMLFPAPAFEMLDDAPWYFIGANGFDLQHFRNAHDRVLAAEPVVDSPDPFAKRIQLRLKVEGSSAADRLTRRLAGDEVDMTITSWAGTLIFAVSRFKRTTSFGMVSVRPEEDFAMRARVVVWVRRSRHPAARLLLDPVNARIRRKFVRIFLESDLGRMSGVRFHRQRAIEADQVLRGYFEWLQEVHS
jgi:nitrite reductase/ring-hydroxylating ferredoxin subunit